MNTSQIKARQILLTPRGQEWLSGFDYPDREDAEHLVTSLTLISHSEFERGLTRLIETCAADITGIVALYATREVDPSKSYFDQATLEPEPKGKKLGLDAAPRGSDLGSEVRVAAIIRNLAKANPAKFLNHPTVDKMRATKCRGIMIVDDIIGSGKRTAEFLSAIWKDTSIRSWHSFHYVRFLALAYTAIPDGASRVRHLSCRPEIKIVRSCPTYRDMPYPKSVREALKNLCQRYANKTSKIRMALGYGGAMAALVFEHGCPNNAPAILWAPSTAKKPWTPLFPDRTVLPPEASAFPPEIARRDPISVLLGVGQKKLADSGALHRRGETGTSVVVVLGLIAKGVRKASALGYATGLSSADCARILERCIKWGFLTRTHRVTASGLAELHHARGITLEKGIPPKGEDNYYPKKLRRAASG